MSQQPLHINDDLLVKYLLKECTVAETMQVEAWIAASASNKKYFAELETIWQQSKELEVKSDIDTDAAWERFNRKIKTADYSSAPAKKSFPWLRIAAIFILLAVATWFAIDIMQKNSASNQLVSVNSGAIIRTDTLPDASVVVINKNSTLAYEKKFSGKDRKVTLNGEAFFSVSKDKSKTFIIKANDVEIKVIGTSFNVKTDPSLTEVIVETGIVKVKNAEAEFELHAGEMIRLEKSKMIASKEKVTSKLYDYYRTREFKCDNTSLKEITTLLNEVYDLNIVFEDVQLEELKLTTTFKNESPDTILQIIAQTFNLKIAKENGKTILKKQ